MAINRRTFLKRLTLTSGAALAGGFTYGFRSSFLEISRERLARPNFADRLRIVAVSDIHAPSSHHSDGDLVELINAESPDIFILAGDTIDQRGNEGLVRMFEPVKARFAKLAVLGNWEYEGQVDLVKLRHEYESAGIALLINTAMEVSGLQVVGLDDFLHGPPDYRILQDFSPQPDALLVVSHCPGSFDVLTSVSPSPMLVLSGHTHGGQIAPFGMTLVTPRGSGSYVKGWYHQEKHSMYVMRGIGTTGVPLRIGATPELLVLDIA